MLRDLVLYTIYAINELHDCDAHSGYVTSVLYLVEREKRVTNATYKLGFMCIRSDEVVDAISELLSEKLIYMFKCGNYHYFTGYHGACRAREFENQHPDIAGKIKDILKKFKTYEELLDYLHELPEIKRAKLFEILPCSRDEVAWNLLRDLEEIDRKYTECCKMISWCWKKVRELEKEMKEHGLWIENEYGDLFYNIDIDLEAVRTTKKLIFEIVDRARKLVA